MVAHVEFFLFCLRCDEFSVHFLGNCLLVCLKLKFSVLSNSHVTVSFIFSENGVEKFRWDL